MITLLVTITLDSSSIFKIKLPAMTKLLVVLLLLYYYYYYYYYCYYC